MKTQFHKVALYPLAPSPIFDGPAGEREGDEAWPCHLPLEIPAFCANITFQLQKEQTMLWHSVSEPLPFSHFTFHPILVRPSLFIAPFERVEQA